MRYVDTHCHLFMLDHAPVEHILTRARMQGVAKMITVSTDEGSWESNRNLAAAHDDLYYTLGLHPHDAIRWTECAAHLNQLFDAGVPAKCVAIGEMGLDFHYEFSPREAQIDVFEAQLRLATKCDLPVVIHCRDAFPALFDSIRKVGLGRRAGVMHCFTGTTAEAKTAVELGFKISFSGILTFKNSKELRETAKTIPLSALMIETDCPFLTPMPFRGKPNEPGYLSLTAEVLAKTLDKPLEEISQLTTENAVAFFRLE